MPTNRRRRPPRRRRDGLTPGRLFFLLHGIRPILPLPGEGMSCYQPYRGEEEQRATYFAHRRALLAGCPLGSRPWAFWKFDPAAPKELCRMLRGQMLEPEGEIIAGLPQRAVYIPFDGFDEPTWRYLQRFGLLSAQERAQVAGWEEQLFEELTCWDLEHDAEGEDLDDADPEADEALAGPRSGAAPHLHLLQSTVPDDEVDIDSEEG